MRCRFQVSGFKFQVSSFKFGEPDAKVVSHFLSGGGKVGTFQSFEEIEAWQKARILAQEVYRITGQGAFSKDFGLSNQIRRAAVSVMSNIAEGYERSGSGEFMQFLSMAKGSAGEARSQFYVALDQGYIERETFDDIIALVKESSRLIAGLMNYLRKSSIRGVKYKRIPSSTSSGSGGTPD